MELKPAIVLSDSIVEEMRALTVELEKLEPVVAPLGERLWRVLFDYMKELNGQIQSDEDIELTMGISGRDALENAAMRVVDHLACAMDSQISGDPEWLKPLRPLREAWFAERRAQDERRAS
jgi:hypothetical protein